MTLWIWIVLCVFAVGSVLGFVWFLGLRRGEKNQLKTEIRAETAESAFSKEKKTSEIFTRPRGDKPTIVDRL